MAHLGEHLILFICFFHLFQILWDLFSLLDLEKAVVNVVNPQGSTRAHLMPRWLEYSEPFARQDALGLSSYEIVSSWLERCMCVCVRVCMSGGGGAGRACQMNRKQHPSIIKNMNFGARLLGIDPDSAIDQLSDLKKQPQLFLHL